MTTLQLNSDHPYINGRHCSACGEFKLASEFSLERDVKAKDGISMRKQCRPCREHIKWTSFIKRTYGITADDYYEMLEKQDCKCAICGSEQVNNMRVSSNKLFIDHCHTSGEVRGLLCSKCNHALGLFNDDVNLLHSAIEYLNK